MNYLAPSHRFGINAISGTPTLWTPAAISPQVWLDADDPATLYDATSGGALVATHGGQVKRWEDKSGNGFHVVESFNPPRRATAANTRANRGMLAFNKGETTRIANYAATFNLANICVAFVVREIMPVDYAGILSLGSSGAGNDYDATNRAEFDTAYTGLKLAGSFGGHGLPLQYGVKCGALACYVINQYAGTQNIYKDGVLITTTAVAASGTSLAGFLIGSRWVAGAVSTNYLCGEIGEVIVSAGLNSTNVAALSAYLIAKFITGADALPSLYGTPKIAYVPDSNKDVFNRYCLVAGHRDTVAALYDVTGNGHNAYQLNNSYLPLFFKYTGRKYLAFRDGKPSTAGARVYTDNYTGLNFNGETTIQMELSLPNGTASGQLQTLVSRLKGGFSNANSMWVLFAAADGRLVWGLVSGTTDVNIYSTAALPFGANQKFFIRCHYVPNTGSGQYAVTYETSPDGTTWTQLGSTVTGTSFTMNNNATEPIEFGSLADGVRTYSYALDIYSFQMWNGSTAGSLVCDWWADDGTHWGNTTTDRAGGRVFNHAAVGYGIWSLIGKSCYFVATHYFDASQPFATTTTFTAAFYVSQTSGNVWGFTTNGSGPPHAPLKYATSLYSYGSFSGSGSTAPALVNASTVVGRVTASGGAGDTTTNGATVTNTLDIASGTYGQFNRVHRRGFSAGEDTPSSWFGRQVWYDTLETPASVETWLKA